MVDNDTKIAKNLKWLQAWISHLSESWKRLPRPKSNILIEDKNRIGRKACDLYVAGDPFSVGFTISSLMFATKKEGREIKGFF